MPRRRTLLPLAVVGALLALTLLWASGILASIQNRFRWMTLPLVRVFAIVGSRVGSRLTLAPSSSMLEERIRELEARLDSVSVDSVKLRALEEENRSLRKLAGFLDASGYDHVSARIIARSPDAREAVLLIDRGAQDGLETGMAVIAHDGIFVGKIASLKEHVATVLLVSDERSRLAASVAGQRELAGLIQGEGNGVAKLTLIPQSVSIKRNDIVVTAGIEERVPPHLVVGFVNHVEGKPTDPFKVASLQPMLDFSRIELVAVLRPAALRPSLDAAL